MNKVVGIFVFIVILAGGGVGGYFYLSSHVKSAVDEQAVDPTVTRLGGASLWSWKLGCF